MDYLSLTWLGIWNIGNEQTLASNLFALYFIAYKGKMKKNHQILLFTKGFLAKCFRTHLQFFKKLITFTPRCRSTMKLSPPSLDFGEVIGLPCPRNKGKPSIYKRKSKRDYQNSSQLIFNI